MNFLQGIKPASLGKVNNPQLKQFIEKCLVPASERPPAAVLLKDPFLAPETPKEPICDPLQLPDLVPKLTNLPSSESHPMDVDTNSKKVSACSSAKSNIETPLFSALELQLVTENNKFILKGERKDTNTIPLTLRIVDECGRYIYSLVFSLCSSLTLLADKNFVSIRQGKEYPLCILHKY